ncbi:uncharacterized protein LOC133821854 [Humulus lupulus]|uniref:uncharacterized protein LOC133821854 n=1 Tax=Humulus lupulus TaxID=3486 RepID=UPI002B4158F2|nr:uncharacterized protein LOC133821854 [Humulus lupulus]
MEVSKSSEVFFSKMRSQSIFSFLLALLYFSNSAHTIRFYIINNCPHTVWAAAIPGGGRQLISGETWILDVNQSTKGARIWARTGCRFDEDGRGKCDTGDCGGVLDCQSYGQPPNTLAEYVLTQDNKLEFFDISLVEGFNVPMEFSPTLLGAHVDYSIVAMCTTGIKCVANITKECPAELRAATGGCHNPCTVFKTAEYCCTSGSCGPTGYSRFFKERCPDANSYPKDDATLSFTCYGWINYNVVFCPSENLIGFNITNNCSFDVWAAAMPGGGKHLSPGKTWGLDVISGTEGRIWARTGCVFNSTGQGRCASGDCDGVLECQSKGRAPHTLAEYSLNKVKALDFRDISVIDLDISLIEGFNIPMEISPRSTNQCDRRVKCAADINGLCPMELRDPAGCNNPCTVFGNDQFCCRSGDGRCEPTSYSKYFKDHCPDVITYPRDYNSTSSYSCPNGTNYNVVFCP